MHTVIGMIPPSLNCELLQVLCNRLEGATLLKYALHLPQCKAMSEQPLCPFVLCQEHTVLTVSSTGQY